MAADGLIVFVFFFFEQFFDTQRHILSFLLASLRASNEEGSCLCCFTCCSNETTFCPVFALDPMQMCFSMVCLSLLDAHVLWARCLHVVKKISTPEEVSSVSAGACCPLGWPDIDVAVSVRRRSLS